MKRPRNESTGKHKPDIQRRLMNAERNRARILVMRCDQRKCARRVERFASACGYRPEEYKPAHAADKAGAGRHQRPEEKRCSDNPLAAKSVAEKTGERSCNRQGAEERRIDPSNLKVGQMKFLLYRNRQKSEQNPVRLMEKESARQKRQHYPFITGTSVMYKTVHLPTFPHLSTLLTENC